MNDMNNFALADSGYDAFSWFDIGPLLNDSGQTFSFPDYLYGTVLDIAMKDTEASIIMLHTVDGPSPVKIVRGTNFIGCNPDDLVKGGKVAVAISRQEDCVIARKIMMFFGG